MDSHITLISELKSLDLRTYPYKEVLELIKQFGQFGSIRVNLPVGKSLIRTRPNEPGKTFTTRSELSYKPAKFNNTYQRASTPFQTMFYGCPIPNDEVEGAEGSARVVATFEGSRLMRQNMDGEQRITYSRWRVKKPIPLFVICHHQDFHGKSSFMQALFQKYLQAAKRMGESAMRASLEISSYLAGEFAKQIEDDSQDFQYMISAIFSEVTTRNPNDIVGGIYYPSVRSDGMVYNVAIAPDYADENLELIAAGECVLYKKGLKAFLDAETACVISDESKPFKFFPLTQYSLGRERSLAQLNKM